jgi:hypothetical protein
MKTFQASSPKILGLEYSRRRNPTKWISISSSPRDKAHHDVLLSRLEAYVFLRTSTGITTITGISSISAHFKTAIFLLIYGPRGRTKSITEPSCGRSVTNLERSHCAAEVPLPNANPKGDQFVSQFRDWQVETKCDSAAIAIAPSKNVSLNAQFRTAMTYVENCCTFDTLPRSSIGAIKHCRRQFRPPVPHLQGRGKYATIFLKRFKYSTCKVEHKIISMPVHSVGD